MKTWLFLLSLTAITVNKAHADFLRLEDDALSSPEKADETAQIINNNFGNLWATKIDVSTPAASGPDRYVADLLDPDQADANTFIILDNADRLWEEKVDYDGIANPGGRSVTLQTIYDPENTEDIIKAINAIFEEIDNAKVDTE